MGAFIPVTAGPEPLTNLPLLWRYHLQPALLLVLLLVLRTGYYYFSVLVTGYVPPVPPRTWTRLSLPLSAFGTKNHTPDDFTPEYTLSLAPFLSLSLSLSLLHYTLIVFHHSLSSRAVVTLSSSLFPIREYYCILHCYTTICCIRSLPLLFPIRAPVGLDHPRLEYTYVSRFLCFVVLLLVLCFLFLATTTVSVVVGVETAAGTGVHNLMHTSCPITSPSPVLHSYPHAIILPTKPSEFPTKWLAINYLIPEDHLPVDLVTNAFLFFSSPSYVSASTRLTNPSCNWFRLIYFHYFFSFFFFSLLFLRRFRSHLQAGRE